MKNLQKRKVRSKNKVRALFPENKVRFARAEQLWWRQMLIRSGTLLILLLLLLSSSLFLLLGRTSSKAQVSVV